jgi:ATP-dependent protease Clp ATPase subunit
LEKLVRKRVREANIGFAAANRPEVNDDTIFQEVQTRDFVDFGFEPEFIGRLPVRVVCLPLNVDDLFQILKSSEGSIIRQYEQSFAAYGIAVLFHDDGLRRIAELAAEEKTGARGLMTVCERIFRDLKFELPSTHVKRFAVTRALVDNPLAALKKLTAEQEKQEHAMLGQVVEEFARRFQDAHGLQLQFSAAAVDRIVAVAVEQGKPVRDFCAEKFKDYQFGLKLIAQNTGRKQFAIDADAVDNPDKVLSDLVIESYRTNGSQPS